MCIVTSSSNPVDDLTHPSGSSKSTTAVVTPTKTQPESPNQPPPPLPPNSVLLSNEEPSQLYREAWTPKASSWAPYLPSGFNHLLNKVPIPQQQPRCETHQVHWKVTEDHADVAHAVAAHIDDWFEGNPSPLSVRPKKQRLQNYARFRKDHLVRSMETFVDFCQTHLDARRIAGYKLKISDMRGSRSTQCPAFHADNVPCRYVETLFGVGTVFLDPAVNDYRGILRDHVLSNTPPPEYKGKPDWKERLLESQGDKYEVSQAPTGCPAVLIGHRWRDLSRDEYRYARSVTLHRSPRDVPAHAGRILLTYDVVIKEKEGPNGGLWCSEHGCYH